MVTKVTFDDLDGEYEKFLKPYCEKKGYKVGRVICNLIHGYLVKEEVLKK